MWTENHNTGYTVSQKNVTLFIFVIDNLVGRDGTSSNFAKRNKATARASSLKAWQSDALLIVALWIRVKLLRMPGPE